MGRGDRQGAGSRLILLDTHVLVWYRGAARSLGGRARSAVDLAFLSGEAAVSAITFWEVAMLVAGGRIKLADEVGSWRRRNLRQGLTEIPVDGEIAVRAGSLERLPGDPADRIIVATAMDGHRLITADQRILDWDGPLPRLDARQ